MGEQEPQQSQQSDAKSTQGLLIVEGAFEDQVYISSPPLLLKVREINCTLETGSRIGFIYRTSTEIERQASDSH